MSLDGGLLPGCARIPTFFVEQIDEDRQRSASWTLARERLEAACKDQGTELLRPDTARNHIREYMRLLFTGRRHSDPERFIRTFIRALSFEDMRSVEEFVHNFLLEQDNIDIGELRNSISRYRDIQKDIHDLERKLEALRHIQELVTSFIEWLGKEELNRDLERLVQLIEGGATLLANLRAKADAAGEMGKVRRVIQDHATELAALDQHRESLEAQINAETAADKRSLVSRDLRLAEQEWSGLASRLQVRFTALARAATVLEHKERLAPCKLGKLFHALEQIQSASAGLQPPEWPRDPYEMEELAALARDAASSDRIKVLARRDDAIARRQEHEREIADLKIRLVEARQGRVRLDDRTIRLMAELERAGMQPRAICQVVEIKDESWREAAEALLGRDREAILVEPDETARAVEIYRGARDAFRGCRIVNSRRLQEQMPKAQSGSLATVFGTEDQLAQAFINHRTGNVQLAETQAELLAGGRAIMRDGAYNSGIIVEVLRASDLKMGRAAAPLMEAALLKRLDQQTELAARSQEVQRFHEDIERRIQPLTELVNEEDRLERLVQSMAQASERRLDAQRRLDGITASIDPKLRSALDQVKLQIRELSEDEKDLIKEEGRLQQVAREIGARLGAGEGQPGSWLCLSARRRLFRERIRSPRRLKALRSAYMAEKGRPLDRLAAEFSKRAQEARDRYRDVEEEVRQALGHYRAQFDSTAPVAVSGQIVNEVKPWVESNVEALEGNELIRYRRQADEAAEQIRFLFRTAFVQELNARFSKLSNELANLSRALMNRPLHGEIYSLHARPKPEFAELHRLVRESEQDDTLFEALFGRSEPRDSAHDAALAEIERLLSEESFDFTEYQDYRNYFTYDLRMQDVEKGRQLSYDRRKGTASGAERQVPYYVIIGAALASIYHGARREYARAELGLGLAVFDEAFSKMDGPNQRTLLEFYEDIGLQVVIAAPSEKRAIVYENLDTIIDVFRHGDAATADTVRIKAHARESMRRANPQHLSDAELVEGLSAAQADAAE